MLINKFLTDVQSTNAPSRLLHFPNYLTWRSTCWAFMDKISLTCANVRHSSKQNRIYSSIFRHAQKETSRMMMMRTMEWDTQKRWCLSKKWGYWLRFWLRKYPRKLNWKNWWVVKNSFIVSSWLHFIPKIGLWKTIDWQYTYRLSTHRWPRCPCGWKIHRSWAIKIKYWGVPRMDCTEWVNEEF